MKKSSYSLACLRCLSIANAVAIAWTLLSIGNVGADDLLITNGSSSNFSSGINFYGVISVGTSVGVVDGNNLTVVNTDTVVASTGNLTVGGSGSGNSLQISSGGSVVANDMLLGQSSGSHSNSIVVTGTGSSLGVSRLFVGNQFYSGNTGGTGNTLEVSAGGSLTSGNSSYLMGSSNSVLVAGSGSTWTNNGYIIVGATPPFTGGSSIGNSLVISSGGKVVSGGGDLRIGDLSGDNQNSVTVTGAGSLLTNGGDLIVGFYGSSNSLVVSGGGTVANANGFIGEARTDNTALVSGAGSLWTNSGTLTVGGSPSGGAAGGTLTVANGGTVAAAGGITIATQAGDTGTLNIGRFGTNDTAGSIIAPTIAFGSGTGVINFNQSDSTTVSAAISGNGSVNQLGNGTTTLSGANTYSGTTTVAAGELAVSSIGSIASGGVTVQDGATLENNGTIGGTTTFNSGGTLAGNGGTFGTVKMMGGSSLKWDVSSFTGAAGSAWDQLGATSLDLSDLSPLNQMTIYLIGTSGQGNPTTNSYSFAFFNTTGGVSGFNSSDFLFDTTGLTLDPTLVGGDWSVVLAADSLNLVYTSSVPEPSQVAASILLIGGIAGFVIVRRRKALAA